MLKWFYISRILSLSGAGLFFAGMAVYYLRDVLGIRFIQEPLHFIPVGFLTFIGYALIIAGLFSLTLILRNRTLLRRFALFILAIALAWLLIATSTNELIVRVIAELLSLPEISSQPINIPNLLSQSTDATSPNNPMDALILLMLQEIVVKIISDLLPMFTFFMLLSSIAMTTQIKEFKMAGLFFLFTSITNILTFSTAYGILPQFAFMVHSMYLFLFMALILYIKAWFIIKEKSRQINIYSPHVHN